MHGPHRNLLPVRVGKLLLQPPRGELHVALPVGLHALTKTTLSNSGPFFERDTGFEPATPSLGSLCSTN